MQIKISLLLIEALLPLKTIVRIILRYCNIDFRYTFYLGNFFILIWIECRRHLWCVQANK